MSDQPTPEEAITDPADPIVAPPEGTQPEPASPEGAEPEGESVEVAKLRKEAASYRTRLRAQEQHSASLEAQLKSIGKALGFDDQPDADALTSELDKVRNEFRIERIQNVFLRMAAQVGADGELAWHVLNGNGVIAELDHTAADLDEQVKAALMDAMQANSKLKAVTPGSGDQGPRGTGKGTQLTRDDLKQMSPEQIEKARVEGRLDHLLGAKT